jgi:carbon-monoxide dehydrogenase medium subunit
VQYLAARSIEEALSALAEGVNKKPRFLAGGTDLVVQIAEGALDPELLIDIGGIPELRGIRFVEEGLCIGAAVTIAELVEAADQIPRCLVQGARSIGSPQIRQLGTIGGNICNASPCGDTLAPLIVLAARFVLRSAEGVRAVPAEEFFLGPKATVLGPGEILESILIPSAKTRGCSAFRMIGKRNGQVISQVNMAVWLNWAEAGPEVAPAADTPIGEIRVAAGSVAPIPLRLENTEQLLQGVVPDPGILMEAEQAVRKEIQPISDVRTSQEYRRSVCGALFREAMAEALGA